MPIIKPFFSFAFFFYTHSWCSDFEGNHKNVIIRLSPDLVCSRSPFPFGLTLVPSSIHNNSHMFMQKYWTFFHYWQLRKATVSASLQEQYFLKVNSFLPCLSATFRMPNPISVTILQHLNKRVVKSVGIVSTLISFPLLLLSLNLSLLPCQSSQFRLDSAT